MSHHHHHHHDHDQAPASPRLRRLVVAATVPFVVATVVGVIVLWPSDRLAAPPPPDGPVERLSAVVESVSSRPCDQPGQQGFRCSTATFRLDAATGGQRVGTFEIAEGENVRRLREGDRIYVGYSDAPGAEHYFFLDYQRSRPLLLLAALFVLIVLVLTRGRGLAALAGTFISLAFLVVFMLPAILEGSSPILVSIVGGAAVMFATIYLAHGLNVRTTTAVLGTLASLTLTGVLAAVFVEAVRITGFGSEEAAFLQVTASQVNLQGLLLGGIIIGSLGVLDDVTVTQASAVWEIHRADPSLARRDLYLSALRIGRAHIASTVNTLVLAYAGASLPLLILFSLSDRSLGDLLTTEILAEEIVRTLVGSIGLVASVPVTTALATLVVTHDGPDDAPRATPGPGEGFRRPRAEAEWRSDPKQGNH